MQTEPAGPMINQVTFEGFVARAWLHGYDRFLRLTNHRPPNQGGPIPQSNMVNSDYTTVRLDPSIEFDVNTCRRGTRIVVRGRVEGRDIPETIGEILNRCNVNLLLPMNYSNVVVTRPITQIFATTVDIKQWHPDSARADHRGGRPRRSKNHHPAHHHAPSAPSQPVQAAAPNVAASAPEPGQDLAELVTKPATAKIAADDKKTMASKKKAADKKEEKKLAKAAKNSKK